MNILKTLLILLVLTPQLKLNSQTSTIYNLNEQLINNCSFEMNYGCPRFSGQIELCKDWYSPWERDSPDYWCANCDSMSNGISFDSLYPKKGNCFTTIVIRNGKYYSAQEHLQTKLTKPLVKDSLYKLTFYVKTGDDSHYFTDRLSVVFTTDSLSSFGFVNKKKYWLPESKKAILLKDKLFYSNDYKWQKVSLNYLSKGGEKFITIGLFSNQFKGYKRESKFRTGKGDGTNLGYYDLDEFSCKLIQKD